MFIHGGSIFTIRSYQSWKKYCPTVQMLLTVLSNGNYRIPVFVYHELSKHFLV